MVNIGKINHQTSVKIMATYTRTYPNTGSTLKVVYPDGLFKFVGDATEWYQDDEVEQSIENNSVWDYPDAILIPEKGAYFNTIVTVETTEYKGYVVYKDTDDQWKTKLTADSSASPSDPSYVPGYPDEEEEHIYVN